MGGIRDGPVNLIRINSQAVEAWPRVGGESRGRRTEEEEEREKTKG